MLICLGGFMSSCDDYLETSNPSKLTDETVYTSVYFAESAVKGIYDRLADAQMYAQRISLNWSTNSDIEFVGADETSYNQNSNRGISNYYAAPANSTLLWTRIYQMLERSNLVINGIQESPLLKEGDKNKTAALQALLGEALTMRALGYFELVRLWGDVPFKQEPTKSDLSNVYLPKTDRDTILDRVIDDLLLAEQYLPWVGESAGSITYSNAERISKGFVKGLIARIALTRAGYSLRDKPGFPMEQGSNPTYYYKLAREKCLDILNTGKYSLKDYEKIWMDVCELNTDGVNGENLFEVALGLGQSGEIGYSIGVRFYRNSKYGYGNNSNVVNTSAYYFYSFDREDVRRDATVATVAYSNSNGELKEFLITNPLSYNFAKWDQRWMSKNATWLSYNMNANNKWGYGVNWIVMRYADVLLMFAEAENELNGPTEEAKNALKQIRERAFSGAPSKNEKVDTYVSTLNDKKVFFDAIVNERAWEFGGEGVRKFDLIRWNLLTSKIKEQREAFSAMIEGQSFTIFGKQYTAGLPERIYYRYDADKETILKKEINYYEPNPALDELTENELKAQGYTMVKWMTGFSDANKVNYNSRIKLFSSGLDKAQNGVCDNRYIYPIHSSVIGDYQGVVTNSYGY